MTMGLFQTKPVVCGPALSPAKRLAVPHVIKRGLELWKLFLSKSYPLS